MTTGYLYLDYTILVIGILLIAFIVLKIIRFFMKKALKKASAEMKTDPTKYNFLSNAMGAIIYLAAVITIFYSIPGLRQLGITLFAGAGIFAAVLGFASQSAMSNIISGVFVVIFKPFRVDDVVNISDKYFGRVEDITLRHTVIRDIENKRFIIPNSVVSSEVIHNFMITDEKVANQIYFGIGYSSDIDKAMEIIREEAEKHPNFLDNRSEEDKENGIPAIVMRVMEWADSSINLRATIWSEDSAKGFDLKTDLYKSVKERFDKEGIEIPFPHRKVIMEKEK